MCSCAQWRHLAPTPTTTDYSGLEKIYAWARTHRMAYRGHALLWGEAAPPWFADLPDRAAAIQAITDHITGTCRHFAGRFQSWDVVNEALKPGDGRPDNLRETACSPKRSAPDLSRHRVPCRPRRRPQGAAGATTSSASSSTPARADRDKRRALLAISSTGSSSRRHADRRDRHPKAISATSTASTSSMRRCFPAFWPSSSIAGPRDHADRARRHRQGRALGDPGARRGGRRHLSPLSRCRARLAAR